MDETTKIAGDWTIDDWQRLKASLENDFHNDQLWNKAYTFFEKRIGSRYLIPIEIIEQNSNKKGEGFAISAIICSLIEALETFRQGRVWRQPSKGNPLDETKEYFGSRPIFENFLKNHEPFKGHFSEQNLAREFYQNFRCALLHEAATRNGWRIRTDTDSLVERCNGTVVLNRILFVKAIRKYMAGYKGELLGNAKLKKAYIRKMDSICETA
jgi:hypothetical protein